MGVNDNDNVYVSTNVLGEWNQISGGLKQISVGNYNNIWGVNHKISVYYKTTP